MQKRVFLKTIVAATAAAATGGFATGCTKKPAEIKVGATAGPHAEVVQAAAKAAEKDGLKVQVVEFTDYLGPDKALAEKALFISMSRSSRTSTPIRRLISSRWLPPS